MAQKLNMEYHSGNYRNIGLSLNAESEQNITQTKPIENENPNNNSTSLNGCNENIETNMENPDITNNIIINDIPSDEDDEQPSSSDINQFGKGPCENMKLREFQNQTMNKNKEITINKGIIDRDLSTSNKLLYYLPQNRPNVKKIRWKKLNPIKRMRVIKAYDGKITYDELARKFNYSTEQIETIIRNRDKILQFDEKINQMDYNCDKDSNFWNNLNLEKLVEIIKAYYLNFSYDELQNMFNFSRDLIDKIVKNSAPILKAYKDHHFKLNSINRLNLINRIEVIKLVDGDKKISYSKLANIYLCSWLQIFNIVKNRDIILREYARSNKSSKDKVIVQDLKTYYITDGHCPNKLNLDKRIDVIKANDKDITIYNYTDLSNALNPLRDYAKVKNNLNAINILKQMDDYLVDSTKTNQTNNVLSKAQNIVDLSQNHLIISSNLTENNTNESVKNIVEALEICSYKDALIALEPVEDYAKLKNNMRAVHLVFELEKHLQQIVFKSRKRF